jgi:hypothetical protein
MGFKLKLDTKQKFSCWIIKRNWKLAISRFTRWNFNQCNPGQPYGIRGSDYIYANGQPIINQTGSASRITYQRTGSSNNVIGDINADC